MFSLLCLPCYVMLAFFCITRMENVSCVTFAEKDFQQRSMEVSKLNLHYMSDIHILTVSAWQSLKGH